MSADALPISPTRFAAALTTLPISSLYAKHAEITNQITHLVSSNEQLETFARDNDDRDCYEALLENRLVMKRFEERRDLIRKEVEGVRGLPWRPMGEDGENAKVAVAATAMNGVDGRAAQGQEGINGNGNMNGSGAPGADVEEEGVFL